MNASPSAQPGAASPPGAQSYIYLDPNLGSDSSGPLRQTLLDILRSNANSFPLPPELVRLDGSLVENLGAGVLQILLSASADLEGSGGRLVVEKPSVRLREWIRLTGAPLSMQGDSVEPSEIEER